MLLIQLRIESKTEFINEEMILLKDDKARKLYEMLAQQIKEMKKE